MESLMDNVQVQPWWQYEDDVPKYNVKHIEIGTNKEINQMISKKAFTEVDASMLSEEQLSKVTDSALVNDECPLRLENFTKAITNTEWDGFNRIQCEGCNVYLMAFVDDLLVVANPPSAKPFQEQLEVRLELKRVSQLTVETPLEFLGKSIEPQQDHRWDHAVRCNASTTPAWVPRIQEATNHWMRVSGPRSDSEVTERYSNNADEEAYNGANVEDNFEESQCNHRSCSWMVTMNGTQDSNKRFRSGAMSFTLKDSTVTILK
eukprot:16416-Amphidinium_carterae.6